MNVPNVLGVYVFLVDADEKFRNQASQFIPEQFPGVNLYMAMSIVVLLDVIREQPPYFMVANIESMAPHEADQLLDALGECCRWLVVTWFDDRRRADAEALAAKAGGIAVKKGWFSDVASAVKQHLAQLEKEEQPKSEDALAPCDTCVSKI